MQPQPPLRLTSVDILEVGHPGEPMLALTLRVNGSPSALEALATGQLGVPLVARLASGLGTCCSVDGEPQPKHPSNRLAVMNRIQHSLAAAALVLAAVLAPAAPALAAPGCGANRMCLHDTSTSGPHFEVEPVDAPLNWCNGGLNPMTSYITNNTNYRFIVSTSNDCSANRGIIYPNSSGAMVAPWNNQIRGMYRTSMTSLVAENYPPAMMIAK